MTKKDYIRLAKMLRSVREKYRNQGAYRAACCRIGELLWKDNKRFDFRKWYDACGLGE